MFHYMFLDSGARVFDFTGFLYIILYIGTFSEGDFKMYSGLRSTLDVLVSILLAQMKRSAIPSSIFFQFMFHHVSEKTVLLDY